MQSLTTWPSSDRQCNQGIFTDTHNTLDTEGIITPNVLSAIISVGELRSQG